MANGKKKKKQEKNGYDISGGQMSLCRYQVVLPIYYECILSNYCSWRCDVGAYYWWPIVCGHRTFFFLNINIGRWCALTFCYNGNFVLYMMWSLSFTHFYLEWMNRDRFVVCYTWSYLYVMSWIMSVTRFLSVFGRLVTLLRIKITIT